MAFEVESSHAPSNAPELLRSLLESEARYRLLAENISDVIWVMDLETRRFRYISPSVERLRGYTVEEVMAQHALEALTPESAARVGALITERIAALPGSSNDTYIDLVEQPCKDGSTVWTEVTTHYMLNPSTGQPEIYGVSRDITERRAAEMALHARERMLHSIFRAVPVGISVVRDRVFQRTNTCWCDMFGYAEADTLGRATRFLYDDDAEYERVGRELYRVLPGRSELTTLTRMRRRDGALLEVILTAVPLDSEHPDGNILVVVHDITAQVRAAEACQSAEQFAQAVLDSLDANIAVVDEHGAIVAVNQAWVDFAAENGLSQDYGIGVNYLAICDAATGVWSEEAAPFARGLRQVLNGDATLFEIEYPCHSSVEQRWFLGRIMPYADHARRLAVIIHFNITARKQAEKDLRDSRERLNLALHAAEMGAWEFDLVTGYRTFDPQVCAMLGIDHARFGGTEAEFFAAVHPDDHAEIRAALKHAITADDQYHSAYRAVWADGSVHHIAARGRVLRTDDGTPLRLLGLLQDVTAAWQAETDREQLRQQLIQAQKMESIGRLAGGVAHDFNNMLAVIIGHAESALLELPGDAPVRDDFQQILTTARRSADLTRKLLAFARKQVISPVVLNLNETIASMLSMLQRLIGENIHLQWSPGFELWPVKIDPSQVDQILANLAVNARDAISGVGSLAIETSNFACTEAVATGLGVPPGAYVRISVRDTGSGIDPEVLPNIFDPFFTTKGLGQGTGLGLATVYGIMVQNHGAIDVRSDPGNGTAFHLYLPRCEQPETPADAYAPAAVEPATGTILIVEDEAAILRIAKTFLERFGYDVLTADRPSAALRLVDASAMPIDLLITDMIMPEMNGQDLAAALLARQPDLRTLFMSGYTADIIAYQGILEENIHFLQKPFALAKLAETVQQILHG